MGLGEVMWYPHFYVMPDGTEVLYEDLICPHCGTKADEMYDEADTQLICKCGERFLHNIWDREEELMKRHPDVYKKYGY